MEGKAIFIGELAEAVGVSAQTVRYYERSGLLPEAPRTSSGYRVYGEKALKRLRFIKPQAFHSMRSKQYSISRTKTSNSAISLLQA